MSLIRYIGGIRPGVTVRDPDDGAEVYCPYNTTVEVSDALEAELISQQPAMWEDGGDGSPGYTPPTTTRNIPVFSKILDSDDDASFVLDLRAAVEGDVIGVDGLPTSPGSGSGSGSGQALGDPLALGGGHYSWKKWTPSTGLPIREGDTLMLVQASSMIEVVDTYGGLPSAGNSPLGSDTPMAIGQGYFGPSYRSQGFSGCPAGILGALCTDGYTLDFRVKSPDGAFSSLPTGTQGDELLRIGLAEEPAISGSQAAFVMWRGGGNLTVGCYTIDDDGETAVHTTVVAFSDTDWPQDTWMTFGVVYDGSTLRVRVNDTLKNVTVAVSNSFLPWGSMERGSSGINQPRDEIAASDYHFRRYPRTYDAYGSGRRPAIDIDLDTADPAGWRPEIAGIVQWGSNPSRSAGTADDDEVARAAANGCPMVRLVEFHERAIPTVAGGVITSYDWTNYDSWVNQWISRGVPLHMMVGYVPAALGGGTLGADPPNVVGLTESDAFDLAAEYFAAVVNRTANVLGGDVRFLSFGNEPDASFFWSGTDVQFMSLWVKTSQAVAALPGTLTLGGIDGPNDDFRDGLLDAAETNGLPMDAMFIHNYASSVASQIGRARRTLAAAALRGFEPDIVISEWSGAGLDSKQQGAHQAGERDGGSQVKTAAWLHQAIKHMADHGIAGGGYFRLAELADLTADERYGILGPDGSPYPAFAALSMLWQHTTDRRTATSTYPGVIDPIVTRDTAARRIIVTYSTARFANRDVPASERIAINWPDDLTAESWTHEQIDCAHPFGRPAVVGSGDGDNLPSEVSIGGMGVGMLTVNY